MGLGSPQARPAIIVRISPVTAVISPFAALRKKQSAAVGSTSMIFGGFCGYACAKYAATAAAIDSEGWLHSGDLARVDEDGFYYITGRRKNLIILDSGENVSPEELEKLLGKCTDIKECVVKEMGKKIGAVICCEPDKEQTVRAFVTELNRTLPLYKRISAVECTAEPLPRNAMGKLLRK